MPAIALLLLRRLLLCGFFLGGFSLSASALAASRIAFLTSSHVQSPPVRGPLCSEQLPELLQADLNVRPSHVSPVVVVAPASLESRSTGLGAGGVIVCGRAVALKQDGPRRHQPRSPLRFELCGRGEHLLCRLRIGERASPVSAGDANFGRREQRCRKEPGKLQLPGRADGFFDKCRRLFRRARDRLGERKGLPGLQRGVLVVAFSQFECRSSLASWLRHVCPG